MAASPFTSRIFASKIEMMSLGNYVTYRIVRIVPALRIKICTVDKR